MDRIEAVKALNRIPVNYIGMTIDEANLADEALSMAARALRPITREQVEKMRGEIVETVEKGKMKRVFSCCGCDFTSLTCWITPKFCPSCGAPMTDEAVETIMKRMEEMRND